MWPGCRLWSARERCSLAIRAVAGAFGVWGLLTLSAAHAEPHLPPKPASYTPVTDTAHFLDAMEQQRLHRKLSDYARRSGPQIAIVTVSSIGDRPLQAYALELANDWGIGRARYDDGILILLVRDVRKVRLEVGRGLVTRISDRDAQSIIDQSIVPNMRQGQPFRALDAATDEIIGRLSADNDAAPPLMGWPLRVTGLLVALFGGAFFWARFFGARRWHRRRWRHISLVAYFVMVGAITAGGGFAAMHLPGLGPFRDFIVFGLLAAIAGTAYFRLVAYFKEKDTSLELVAKQLDEYRNPQDSKYVWARYAPYFDSGDIQAHAEAIDALLQRPLRSSIAALRDAHRELHERRRNPENFHRFDLSALAATIEQAAPQEERWNRFRKAYGKRRVDQRFDGYRSAYNAATQTDDDEQRSAAQWAFIKDHWIPLNSNAMRYFEVPELNTPRRTASRRNKGRRSSASPSTNEPNYDRPGDSSGGAFDGDGASGGWS